MSKQFRLLLSLPALLALAGCLNLEPISDTTSFHLLGQEARQPVAPVEIRVAIRDTHLLDYLNNSQVVELSGSNEIRYLSQHRWAGTLDSMISQVVAAELENAVSGLYATAGDSPDAGLNIDLTILQFVLTETAGVAVSLEYRIVDAESRETVAEGRLSRANEDAGSSVSRRIGSLEAALREAVREMAAEIR